MKQRTHSVWWWAGLLLAAIAVVGMCLPGSAWVAIPTSADWVVETDDERESE